MFVEELIPEVNECWDWFILEPAFLGLSPGAGK